MDTFLSGLFLTGSRLEGRKQTRTGVIAWEQAQASERAMSRARSDEEMLAFEQTHTRDIKALVSRIMTERLESQGAQRTDIMLSTYTARTKEIIQKAFDAYRNPQ